MRVIPLSGIASQTLTTVLGGQVCTINIYQKAYGVFVDVLVNNVPVLVGVIAENRNRIIRYEYLNFKGDLAFFDTQGDTDPYYPGLGTRYKFVYMTEEDIQSFP